MNITRGQAPAFAGHSGFNNESMNVNKHPSDVYVGRSNFADESTNINEQQAPAFASHNSSAEKPTKEIYQAGTHAGRKSRVDKEPNRQKRVVHMTTVHHPYDPRIYHKQCKSLKKAGYDVTLIAQAAPDDHLQKNGPAGLIKSQTAQDDHSQKTKPNEPIKHIKLKKYTSRLKRMIFGTLETYKQAKKLQADVYHFHDPELMFVGWLLKKKNNVVIYDIHEDYVTSILQKEYLNKPMRKWMARIYKFFEKFFTRKMELCLAEKYYKDIYNRGTCILNYPTINETFLTHDRKDKPLTDKLLYTGNVTDDRGALIHAKIPHIHEDMSVHFIGKCPRELAEKMYDVAKGRKDQLHIEGIDRFIEKEAIEAKYLSENWLAGIALFPPTDHYMKKELTKFFEYMNAGLPILCSNFPIWKEFVETYQCGLAVDPYNEKEVKQAIDYLRNHQEEAKQMGENGRQAVIEQLNWLKEEEKLIKWYETL